GLVLCEAKTERKRARSSPGLKGIAQSIQATKILKGIAKINYRAKHNSNKKAFSIRLKING
ncbi:MAG: hypothetical protein ACO27N_06025, partial [Bacteroidia bacterium]